jgi:phospholipase C
MNPQQRPADPIKHVVLLIFENHSFDQMLGCFRKVYPGLEGIPANPGVNRDDSGREYRQTPTTERQMILDPHHEVNHVEAQLRDNNGGFVLDFVSADPGSSIEQRQYIMGYYPLDFLPALHRLARDFTICDHWYASVPGPTWPNRFFALTGTSQGRVNMPEDGEHTVDFRGWFQQTQDTLFDRLSGQGISWKVYFHDIPQTVCLMHQRRPENAARYFPVAEFYTDARGSESDFPSFCFIEPDFNGITENDDHPPHDVMKAQKLLADVYNALRSNENVWASTLLVVVYDEHGGFYDHVEPPSAIRPDGHTEEYAFDRLGVRVPALLISPWVQRGFDSTQFDHTSLLKYLMDKWGLDPLGERAAQAKSIGPLIHAAAFRTDTPEWIVLSSDQLCPPDADLEEMAEAFISGHHRALALLGHYLKLEIDEELPVVYSWLARLYESARHWWVGSATTPEAIQKNYEDAKSRCLDFLGKRKEQAIPILGKIVRDEGRPMCIRHHAAEALGYVVNRRFHRQPDPARAAMHWLERHGR